MSRVNANLPTTECVQHVISVRIRGGSHATNDDRLVTDSSLTVNARRDRGRLKSGNFSRG